MLVTLQKLEDYIREFHKTMSARAQAHIPVDAQHKLLHLALLPSEIVGYISESFGVLLEYREAKQTSIRVDRGMVHAEAYLFGFVQPVSARVTGVELKNVVRCSFTKVGFKNVYPVRLISGIGKVTFEDVNFEWSAFKKHIRYAEIFGNREADFWSVENAQLRATEQVLAALDELHRAGQKQMALHDYLREYRDSRVLLLGCYDAAGLERLNAIAGVVRSCGYEPTLISEQPDTFAQSLAQKVALYGNMARFVLVDDSGPSGHLVEVGICEFNKWVTVLLRDGGHGSTTMTAGLSAHSRVLDERAYDPANPEVGVRAAIAWAEETRAAVGEKFRRVYPWVEE